MDIELAPKQRQQLEALARAQGMSVEEALRQLLESALSSANPNGATRSSEACYDLANSAGVIGMVGDLPEDQSTNPDHFNGFGRG